MKFKHNKKRNTAFVFESLVREVVKSVIAEDLEKKDIVVSTLKKFFNKDTELYKELQIYKSILEARDMAKEMKEKVVKEARLQHSKLNKDQIFKAQTFLIKEINRNVSKDIFNNFVPNYKNLATIYNFLNMDMSPKRKVILENQLIEELQKIEEEKQIPTDKLTFDVFMKKYNEKYAEGLLKEQKKLLNTYITSFSDNGLGMKVFLNEELGRIKTKLKDSLENTIVKESEGVKEKILKVTEIVESFKNQPINSDILKNILKIQSLLNEMNTNV
tara:strand:- start:1331 stop:2149 length:819 start_codon:yes stop_codon:yes gene_type:complete